MTTYLICSVERSGSTLLAALLEGTGELGNPLVEPFRVRVETEAVRAHSFTAHDQYLAHARAVSATPNGVAGIKLMWRHLARVMAEIRRSRPDSDVRDVDLLAEYFPGLAHFIVTQRRDLIGQAVSWAIAHQSDRWRSTHPGNGRQPKYSFDLIYLLHQNVVADNFGWESWFSANGIEPRRVVFEDWVDSPQLVVDDLSELILGAPAGKQPSGELPAKQSTALNLEWRTRYTEDLAEYLGGTYAGYPRSEAGHWYGL